MRIGVVGSGAGGLAAAWLLAKNHEVVLLEAEPRPGGHAHTAWVDASKGNLVNQGEAEQSDVSVAIDTGFIVYNEVTYPNFTAWMSELSVATQPTNMSFAVSRNDGGFEYAGGTKTGLFAQPANLFKPRFWRMCRDLVRFYRQSVAESTQIGDETLGEFLTRGGYNSDFVNDHLLPFGAAIWSTPQHKMLDYPVASFVRFCENHGLLKLANRPQWRTLSEGSASYVNKVVSALGSRSEVLLNFEVGQVRRENDSVTVTSRDGRSERFDQVVLACHADQALQMIESTTETEANLLKCFAYENNRALLHTDSALMPRRRAAWASWNYVEHAGCDTNTPPGVVYWMNKLQNLPCQRDFFVSLNPVREPSDGSVVRSMQYAHPVFNHATMDAQKHLWELQGKDRLWFCGSYFGAGFHEDAVQSGLAVAEQLGASRRPWSVRDESSRIHLNNAYTDSMSNLLQPVQSAV